MNKSNTSHQILIKAPAKLNLFLAVLGRREDGFHEMETIMIPVSIYDRLTVQVADKFALTCDTSGVPTDESNTISKTHLATETMLGRSLPCHVQLQKGIPHGSGLGGASSDAAAMLRALDQLFALELSVQQAQSILAQVGSDTVFFWDCAPALCTGRGEEVAPLQVDWKTDFVIAQPRIQVQTADVYAALQPEDWSVSNQMDASAFLQAVQEGDGLNDGILQNSLQAAAIRSHPELLLFQNEIEQVAEQTAHLTGSGGAFFFHCENLEAAEHLSTMLTIGHIQAWPVHVTQGMIISAID